MSPLGMVGLSYTRSYFVRASAISVMDLRMISFLSNVSACHAGYCGLVQTCEEDCLASGVSRWKSSGSGNAGHSVSSRHSAGGSPGDVPIYTLRAQRPLTHTLAFL